MFTSDCRGKVLMLPSSNRAFRGTSEAPRHGSADPTIGEEELERSSEAYELFWVLAGVKTGNAAEGAVAGRRIFPRYWFAGINKFSSSPTDGYRIKCSIFIEMTNQKIAAALIYLTVTLISSTFWRPTSRRLKLIRYEWFRTSIAWTIPSKIPDTGLDNLAVTRIPKKITKFALIWKDPSTK